MAKAASELVTTIGGAIKEWSGLKTKELQNQKTITLRTYFGGLGFSAFLLVICRPSSVSAVVARQDHQRTRGGPSRLPHRLLVWPRQTERLAGDLALRKLEEPTARPARRRGGAGNVPDLDDHRAAQEPEGVSPERSEYSTAKRRQRMSGLHRRIRPFAAAPPTSDRGRFASAT